MERPRGFFTKRTEHYNNIQKEENKKKAIEQSLTIQQKELDKATAQSASSPKVENLDPNKTLGKTPSKERPLKCLETLAQKAGITFDEKYENSLTMEKSQSPAQQVTQTQQMPLQLLPEQFSQLQQFQIQQYATGTPTIQVKQEYATQQQPQGISAADLKTLQDHQNQLHQMQIVQDSPQSPHQNQAQNALQQAVQAGQVPAEYLQQRVQVLQQPIQNASYLQQMYSPQLVMSAGSLLAHSGLGQQQQIQLIAGKPFQNQLTPQMLNAAGGKPVLTQGAQGFSYTLPTIPSSQSQTLLFSPVAVNGVISSQAQSQQNNQQNMLSTVQTQNTPTKSDGQKTIGGQKVLQKVSQATAGNQQTATVANATQQAAANQQQQCVQISQTMPTAQILGGQTMQLTPWNMQSLTTTPFWATTTGGIQPQTLVTNTGQLIFRGTNPDGTQMLFQQSPTPTATQTVQSPHNQISLVGNIAQATTATTNNAQKVRPSGDAMNQKGQNQQRAPPILPQGAAPIRPASSVSTQTNQMNQNATMLAKTPKVRTKQTPVRPAASNIKVSINQQTGQPTMMQQVVTPAGANKMVLMSNINGQLTPVLQQSATQQILTNDKLKAQQAQQQVIIQQAMATQQQALQQQIAQIAQLQQQQLLQNAQAQNAQLMQQGGIQQVVLQQQQMPTVTVTSSANLGQQTLPTHLTQQGIMTKAGTQQIFQMTQPVSSQNSSSLATSIANTNPIITSIAGTVTADTSNAIIGPLTSPQTPLQPPQNPLIAMSTLSASPMSLSIQKEKADAASGGDSVKVSTSVASSVATLSPLKRSADQENDSKNDAKKQANENNADAKKDENNKSIMSSPSVKNQQQTPSTPNSTTKAQASNANNSPLTTQNGETDAKKVIANGMSTSTPLLKNELPKAMVKPNVLTHVIEGYVIQESNEPFPVTRQRYSEKENDEPPKKKQAIEETKANSETVKVNGESSSSVSSSTPLQSQSPSDMVACEQCGKQEMRSKLKRKKFCSVNCARASKNSSIEGSPVVASNGEERSVINASPSVADKSKAEVNESSSESPSIEEHVMMKWSVTQVCDFIKNLPGCSDYAEDFALQEIDGQALLLLKENHLVSAMGMKLGPALKIVNKIESMRVSKDAEQSNEDSMEQQQSASTTGQ